MERGRGREKKREMVGWDGRVLRETVLSNESFITPIYEVPTRSPSCYSLCQLLFTTSTHT